MKTRVLKSSLMRESMRFDGSYHNAEMNIYGDIIKRNPHDTLDSLCTKIFTSGRNKRVYTSPEYGYPFLSNSDVIASDPLMSCNYSSRKYGTDENAMLKGGMILTGRVGAIGQTAYVPAYWENFKAMGSDNIIRIVPKKSVYGGYLYAYLASKIGSLGFWKLATGGVQPFVTDSMVSALLIPRFGEAFQAEVDGLIQDSARLREEANESICKAIQYFDDIHTEIKTIKIGKSSIKDIHSGFKRFDAQYQLGTQEHRNINHDFPMSKISDYADSIFIGNRDKRRYVDHDGVPFLSSSDMMLSNPKRWCKFLSKKAKALKNLQVRKGDILISRSGTIGNTVLVADTMNDCAVSEHALRLRINSQKIAPEYVYAFLRSKIGQHALSYLSYGSVIITLGEEYVANIDLPLLDTASIVAIKNFVIEYSSKCDEAILKEDKAIRMVEEEIEKWNK